MSARIDHTVSAIVASASGLSGISWLIAILGLYFLPTIIANSRKVPNFGSVVVVNLFLGWTFIGWVVALAMAFRSTPSTAAGSPSLPPAQPAAPKPSAAAPAVGGRARAELEMATESTHAHTQCPDGHPVPEGASFCPSCGSAVASPPSS